MLTIGLEDFFSEINYDWKADRERIERICYYTKTREDPTISEFRLTRGCEQPFLLKAIAQWGVVERFFEYGTGRGTASYSIALNPYTKSVLTTDLLKFDQKFPTAIGHRAITASIKDLYGLIPYAEKGKVQFEHLYDLLNRIEAGVLTKYFDACFIDGDHTDHETIRANFHICDYMLKDRGLIVFDDYGPERFAVKGVVDQVLREDQSLKSILIEFHGHLFGGEREKGEGLVLMSRGPLL